MAGDIAASVIIPAYRAQGVIARAVASVGRCGLPAETVEIIVASDDGSDYSAVLAAAPSVRFVAPGPVASGPGPTRNRALAVARGRAVAFLDADDSWEPGYLAELLPLVRKAGLCFGATSVLRGEQALLRLPGGDRLSLEAIGACGASFHPVLPRAQAGPFADAPSQDVLHAVEVLAMAGGEAPVGRAAYQLRLGPDTVTRDPEFADRVARSYATFAARIRAGRTRVPPALAERAAQVFDAKQALNAAFAAQRAHAGFYDFVASRPRPAG